MSNEQKTEQEFSKICVKLKNSKNALEGVVWDRSLPNRFRTKIQLISDVLRPISSKSVKKSRSY